MIGVLGFVGVLFILSRILWLIISLVSCWGLVLVVLIVVVIWLWCMIDMVLVVFIIL